MTIQPSLLAKPTPDVPRRQHFSLMMAVPLLLVALAALTGHSILGAWFGFPGFIWLIGLTTISMFVSLEFAYALMLTGLFLQNALTSLVSPLIPDPSNFSVLLGSNIVNIFLTALFSLAAWMKWRSRMPKESQMLFLWMGFFLGSVIFYGMLGAISSSPANAVIYSRIYLVGVLMLLIGGVLGLRLDFGYALNFIRLLAAILVGWGLLEFLFPDEIYGLFNIRDYLNLKAGQLDNTVTFGSVSELIQYYTDSYLNLSGQFGLDLFFLRPKGPNIHSISYAYALAFCFLVCFANRFHFLGAACLFLLLVVGAKGAIILTFATVGIYMVYQWTRNRLWFLTALVVVMIVYLTGGLIYGYLSADYHVLGFLGGINGFLKNPLGYGIGVGGNMSSMGMKEANFQVFQNLGVADFALESAFGVMLYQFGIGIAVFLIFYWKLWRSVWKATETFHEEPRLMIIPAALALLLVNSVFQEEAFSPLGWGLWMLLSGLLLGKYWKRLATPAAPLERAL